MTNLEHEIKFHINRESPNDFIIHMPDKMRTIYEIKGTQSDYLNFLNNPQKMHNEGIIIGVYPNNLADKFEENEKKEFKIILLHNKQIIHKIAGSFLTSNKDLENLKIIGLVFCHNLNNITVSNNSESFKIANVGPQGEINFPHMLRLNIQV
jgi:ribosomal protein S17E